MSIFMPHVPRFASLMDGDNANDDCCSAICDSGDGLDCIGRRLGGHDSYGKDWVSLVSDSENHAKAEETVVYSRTPFYVGLAAF